RKRVARITAGVGRRPNDRLFENAKYPASGTENAKSDRTTKDTKNTKDTKRISGEGHDTHARGAAPRPFTLNGPLPSSSCSSCPSGPSWWSGVGFRVFALSCFRAKHRRIE